MEPTKSHCYFKCPLCGHDNNTLDHIWECIDQSYTVDLLSMAYTSHPYLYILDRSNLISYIKHHVSSMSFQQISNLYAFPSFHLKYLTSDQDDYKFVKCILDDCSWYSSDQIQVQDIQKVDNPWLHILFDNATNGLRDYTVKYLFYGGSEDDYSDTIVHGFQPSRNEYHDGLDTKGVYLYSSIMCAHDFSSAVDGVYKVLLCKVAFGTYDKDYQGTHIGTFNRREYQDYCILNQECVVPCWIITYKCLLHQDMSDESL